MSLYLLGFASAIASGWLLNKTLKVKGKSFFVIEMPAYKIPSIKNVLYMVIEKTKAFVFGAGKIILAISIILWFLASNGPTAFENAEETIKKQVENQQLNPDKIDQMIASYKLENSYIGIAGKTIEPAIVPLGYDWKVGIALISSIAAREVFVGTMSIIYSIDSEEDLSIMQKLDKEINANTGKRTFNVATCISLLLFYAFSLQCMSTIAVTYKETKSIKWTSIQFIYMTALAYFVALIAYQILK